MKRHHQKPSREIEATASMWIARRDAGLTPGQQAEFSRWLADDAQHAAAFARHEQTWEILGRPFRSGAGSAMAGQFRRTLARRRRRQVGTGLAAAACVLAAVVFWRAPSRPSPAAVAGARATVLVPESRTLADGTIVELKADAEIAVQFDERFRRVALRRGEAHFQVKREPARPFVVAVAGIEVRAVGTAFSVERGESSIAVVVTEGQVAVEQASERLESVSPPSTIASGNASLANLAAGAGVVVGLPAQTASAPRVARLPEPEIAERLAWRVPRLEFTGASLSEAIALMNRHGRLQFVIADPAVGEIEVSGFFRADNSEAFLRLIGQGLGVRSERRGDTVVLRSAR